MELVAITFSHLRHVCRFEQGCYLKRQGRAARLKSAAKSENKTYHFTPIKGQDSALYGCLIFGKVF